MLHPIRNHALLFLSSLLLLLACGEDRTTVVRQGDQTVLSGRAQGTTFTIKYVDPLDRDLSKAVDSLLRAVDASLSLWVPGSTVDRFNKQDTFSTNDRMFLEVLALSYTPYLMTERAFDPTVLPVLRAWGLGPKGMAELDTLSVADQQRKVGLARIHTDPVIKYLDIPADPVRVTKEVAGMEFDPNGIAQGYAVDRIAALFEKAGVLRYMIELGGEVRTKGSNPEGSDWTIGIDRPVAGEREAPQQTIALRNMSLATSGNYRKYREVNGRRLGHVIDPRTGRPVEHGLLSVSVIHPLCALADAFATGLLVMGPHEAARWAAGRHDVHVFLIMDDGSGGTITWANTGWPGDADVRNEPPKVLERAIPPAGKVERVTSPARVPSLTPQGQAVPGVEVKVPGPDVAKKERLKELEKALLLPIEERIKRYPNLDEELRALRQEFEPVKQKR